MSNRRFEEKKFYHVSWKFAISHFYGNIHCVGVINSRETCTESGQEFESQRDVFLYVLCHFNYNYYDST